LAAQMKAQATTANVRTLTATITMPRNVLMAAAYDPSGGSTARLGQCSGVTPEACYWPGRESESMTFFRWLYRLPGRIVRSYPTVGQVSRTDQPLTGVERPDRLDHQS
jgi:hypothetical protein